ncbi:MAG: 5-oxoprolinase subunit PxpB [Actinomycetota bacterium]
MLQTHKARGTAEATLLLEQPQISPLGDSALVIHVGEEIGEETHARVRALVHLLESHPPDAMIELIPAFTNVTVIYDALHATYDEFAARIEAMLRSTSEGLEPVEPRSIVIPVCYGGEFGPDLKSVSSHKNMAPAEVVAVHSQPEYLVYMIGFAPGFPYMGGMSERIAIGRRDSPRQRIPAGSVGIAGRQTGIYSIESPGGWQLIGRTPLRLFRPEDEEPSLLRAGDRVRFKSIDPDEYETHRSHEGGP